MAKVSRVVVLVVFLASLAGCVGSARLATPAGGRGQAMGEGQGTAVGFMLFGCIPIKHNDRLERAYQAAVASRNGTAITNPVVTEKWFWTPAGDGFITTVSGTVVRER